MCGLAGLMHFDGQPAAAATITRMTDLLRHRGPDDGQVWLAGPVALGHRRLAIIDLSPQGRQPMTTPDGRLTITYNGELFNYLELREELQSRGCRFVTETDTEVLLQAFREWGIQCLERCNGMFAFALWESVPGRLWLVRDRLGEKPLFFASRPGLLAFASEIKSLLAVPTQEARVDLAALSCYLSLNYTPAPRTLFAGIRQLLPGQWLCAERDGSIRMRTYWELAFPEGADLGAPWYLDRFQALLDDAVALRLRSDAPFGAFLSGGLDSSALVSLMADHLDRPIETFSIGFRETEFDESPYARRMAAQVGAHHHQRLVTAEAASILPELVWHAEEPTADSSMVALYHLARLAREHVAMVLSGDGADELLAGYETYPAHYLLRAYRLLPRWLRQGIVRPLAEALPPTEGKVDWVMKSRRFVQGADHPPETAHALWRVICDAPLRRQLLAPVWHLPGAQTDFLDLYREAFAQCRASHPLNRLLSVDTRLYLPNDMLVKVDRMTMAHGLESRQPFLDHRLVEFLATVPPRHKLKWFFRKKHLLRQAMANRLPAAILQRRKAGFNIPKARWLRGEMREYLQDHLAPGRIRDMGILEPSVVERLVADHLRKRADHGFSLWGLLILSLWWERFKVRL
ncbi:MAG: asparagine synthase (glutamine-hydrolyzing) [Magnetococcales bacterium]|nr:asparagine synthase (glutamine-hydrolyzing) [Magnetococcales bacterium]